MKRNGKLIALALALALCLLLTGCYVAPDDVSNGGETNPGNNLPFQTLQPTETVTMTPDTVVVETPDQSQQGQSVFPSQATPTPSPGEGGNSWTEWGTTGNPATVTGTPTAVPTGGTIVFDQNTPAPGADSTIQTVTETPTPAIPTTPAPITPTPTPKSMRLGFQGDAVRTVQRKLRDLGYYTGSIDGDFGAETEKAVKAFQKANGLSADGKVGELTLKKLNDKNAKTAKQANSSSSSSGSSKATSAPKSTATPNLQKDYYLTIGTVGNRVETLQRRLIELGWLGGKVTGEYDSATETAVRAFQDATSGLWSDGIAGPETLRSLYSSKAARSTRNAATNSADTLQFGSEGSEVTKLQKKLQELGYLAGVADGKFGVETEAAVIAFQSSNNLTADGKAGSATQSKLYSGTANRARGNAVKISGNNSGGRDISGIASTGYETLEFGSTGDAVKKLQNRLDSLGYSPGYTDGKFGASTEAAVMAFQANNGLTVDGKAGPATQRALYGSSGSSAVGYTTLWPGTESTAVRNMQYTLYELGYYDGAIDGKYGNTTEDSVRSFQIENGIKPVDGVAGSKTLSKLYSSSAVPASAPSDLYDKVQYGDRGEMVLQVQDILRYTFGYTSVSLNSYYDTATVEAVRDFQANHGLTPDGICGSKTLSVLFGY